MPERILIRVFKGQNYDRRLESAVFAYSSEEGLAPQLYHEDTFFRVSEEFDGHSLSRNELHEEWVV
jgi:hypothetical protein